MSAQKRNSNHLSKLNNLVDATSRLINEVITFVEEDLTLEKRKCVPTALLKITLNRMIISLGRRQTVAILNNAASAIDDGEDMCTTGSMELLHIKRATRVVGEEQNHENEHAGKLQ